MCASEGVELSPPCDVLLSYKKNGFIIARNKVAYHRSHPPRLGGHCRGIYWVVLYSIAV
jgi:hypothetical protein